MRAYNLLKQKARDIDMYLFSFVRDTFDKKNISYLEDIGIKEIRTFKRRGKNDLKSMLSLLNTSHSIFYHLYYDQGIAEELLNVVKEKKIDVVHFESYYTACYLSPILQANGVKQLFGSENIEANVYHDYIAQNVRPVLKPFYHFQNNKIRREEETMFRSADYALAVTQSEKAYIEQYTDNPVSVIPNGVDLSVFPFKPKNPGKIIELLFVGSFSYHPNVDAILYFYNNVLPLLDSDLYHLTIVGKDVSKLPLSHDPRVTTHEYVKDIVSMYHASDIFVSPIRIGGGTNFKILESMAVGLPVVTFPHRVSEMGAKHQEHVLIAGSPEAFSKNITRLATDMALRKKVTTQARKLIEEKYAWEQIGKEMNKVWKSLV